MPETWGMKVYFGASDRQQFAESESWSRLLISSGFSDLERWLRSRETDWGQAHVFIETVMPRGDLKTSHNNQIDLLICFDNRIVLCEMKRFPGPPGNRLKDAISQVNGQLSWIKNFLKSHGYDDVQVFPVIFFPFLDLEQLARVRERMRDIHSAWHIWAVGSLPALKSKQDDLGRPYYLFEALEKRLDYGTQNIPAKLAVSSLVWNNMNRVGARLLEFTSFANGTAYMETIAPAHRQFFWDSWYVPGLFSDLVASIKTELQAGKIAEILGSPGSGKSTVIQETIESLDEDYSELIFKNITTRAEIASFVYKSVYGEMPRKCRESEILQSLAGEEMIFWVRECDHVSASALISLLDSLRMMPSLKSRWIVESSTGLPTKNHRQFKVPTLENAAISRIIENIECGGYFSDAEQVLELAQGNPRRAIRLWRSCNEPDANAPDEIIWFRRHLSKDEQLILPVIGHAIANSPLGATFGLLRHWAVSVFPDRGSDHFETVIASLVEKLESQQLAKVSRLAKGTLGSAFDTIFPENFRMVCVDHLAPGVLESIQLKEIDDRLGPNFERLHQSLLASEQVDSLAFVISALLQGDIEPFFRSSFRFTMLPAVADWIDQTNRHPRDLSQIYILRAIRVLSQLGHRKDISAESDLGPPAPNDALQRFVFETGRARIAAYAEVARGFDLAKGLADIRNEPDVHLRCERLVSLARSLQNSSRFEESWQTLNAALIEAPVDSPYNLLAHFRILEFLNRRKQRAEIVSDSDACRIVTDSAREIIKHAVRVENMQAISDALFFVVRSQELLQRPVPSDDDIRDYGDALDFIERTRRRRARRLQILLTHGSLHRHACRSQDVDWESFRRHFDAAFAWYGRAFRSASAQDHRLHKLNALCYMADLCMKAMRFNCEGSWGVVIENSTQLLQMIRAERAMRSAASRDEESLFRTLDDNEPFLLYAEALGLSEFAVPQGLTLRMSWSKLMAEIANRFRTSTPNDWTQYRSSLWKRMERLALNGASHDAERNGHVLGSIRMEVIAILRSTRPNSGPNLRAWRELCASLKVDTNSLLNRFQH